MSVIHVGTHSPWCVVDFLPENYREERAWHCLAHPLLWDDYVIEPNN